MVVQCTNCRARFRVADDKVPDRGVKVRCTKCSTVFKVTRADAVDAKPAGSKDPFGLNTGRTTPAPNENFASITGPQASGGFDPDSSSAPYSTREPSQPHGKIVPNLPPVVSLTYGAASPHQSLDLDLSLGPPSPPSRPMQTPLPAAPPPASGGQLPAIRGQAGGYTPAPGPNPLDAALAQGISIGDPFSDLLGSGAPPPPRPPPAPVDPFAEMAAPAAPAIAFNDPFAVDLNPPPPPPLPVHVVPNLPQPGSVIAGGPPSRAPGGGDPWVNLLQSQPKEETDPFAGLDALPPAPAPAQPREVTREPPRVEVRPDALQRPVPRDEPRQANAPAGFRPAEGGLGEFEMGEATRGHKLDLDYGSVGLNDFAPRPDEKPKREREKEAVELGRINNAPAKLSNISVPKLEEKEKPVDPKVIARSRLRKELASSVFNVASACVVLYAGIVALAWLRAPRAIGLDDIGFPMVWLAFGSNNEPAEQLHASSIHSGFYPTHGGGELFYVEGTADNKSAARHEALYAEVEIRRGDHQVATAEALVQLRATPENLWALDSRKNEDLQKALLKDVPSLEVDARKSGPFVAVFKLTAKDVEGSDIRVSIHDGVPPGLRAAVASANKPGEQTTNEKPADAPAVQPPPAVVTTKVQ